MGIRRIAGAGIGFVLLAGCGASPATSAPSAVPAPFSLVRVPDQPALMGDAVGRPSLVVLPDGTYLMLRSEDMPAGGVLLRSDDGSEWSPVERTDIGLEAGSVSVLVQSDAAIVALGTEEERTGDGSTDPALLAWVSAEGRTWTPLAGADAVAVARFAPGMLVGSPAGFAALPYDGSSAVLLGGPDGRGWRRTVIPAAADAGWSPNAVVPVTDGWIVVGTERGGGAAWRWRGAAWERLPLQTEATVYGAAAIRDRIILDGALDVPDVEHPDAEPVTNAVAWESRDAGATWTDTGLDLADRDSVGIFPVAGGFLAIFEADDRTAPTTVLWSAEPGRWSPVAFEEGGEGFDRPYVSRVVETGDRVVVAGNTVGTGAGGDRVVVWTGEIAGS